MGRKRTRLIWLGLIAVAVLAVGLSVQAVILAERPPTFTCSTSAKACADTEASILDWPQMVVTERLPGRLLSVDVRPIPPEWRQRRDYLEGDWAALLTVEGREPVLVTCYYSSDEMVACDAP